MGGGTTPKSHGQIPCSHYLEWTRQHATQNTRNKKLTTIHLYRFWPRPLVPIVVLATIEGMVPSLNEVHVSSATNSDHACCQSFQWGGRHKGTRRSHAICVLRITHHARVMCSHCKPRSAYDPRWEPRNPEPSHSRRKRPGP